MFSVRSVHEQFDRAELLLPPGRLIGLVSASAALAVGYPWRSSAAAVTVALAAVVSFAVPSVLRPLGIALTYRQWR